MIHRVLVSVVESRQIGFLVSQPRLAIVVPDFARWSMVEFVDPFGGLLVQESEHFGQIPRRVFVAGRVPDEMIVIREHRPCFQLPAEFRSDLEQTSMQNRQPRFAPEVMLSQIRAHRDKVSPANAQAMLRRVWPWDFVSRHGRKVGNFRLRWQVGRDTAFARTGRVGITTRLARSKSAVAAALCRRTTKPLQSCANSKSNVIERIDNPFWTCIYNRRGFNHGLLSGTCVNMPADNKFRFQSNHSISY